MSGSQGYDTVTRSAEGITVTKRFEEDQFPVPAIAFEFTSEREEDVRVRMTDQVPESISVEDLGFHPEYGSEYWTIDEDVITFEREIGANTTYTTVYGIRATGTDDVHQFLSAPTLEEVDPPLESEILPEGETDVVRDVLSGDTDLPDSDGTAETAEKEPDEEVTLDLSDPDVAGSEQAVAAESAETTDSTGETNAGAGASADDGAAPDSLVGALAAEIREQDVAAEDVRLLREAFDVAGGGAENARIEQLQSDVADLRAYTSALEEFLDENGTGEKLIGEFETRLDSFDDRLREVQSEMDAASETVATVDDEMDAVREEMDQVSGEMDAVRGEMEEVSDELGSVHEEIASVDEDVTAVNDEVESVRDEVDAVTGEVAMVGDELDTVHGEIDAVSEDVETVRGDVDAVGEDVETVREDVDAVGEDVETVREDLTGEVGAVRDEVDEVTGELDMVSHELDAVYGEIEAVGEEVDELSEELDTVNHVADAVGDEVDSVREEVDSVTEEIDELGEAIDAVEKEVAALEDQGPDEEVLDRISEMESQLEDLQTWQEKIKQTFGGGA